MANYDTVKLGKPIAHGDMFLFPVLEGQAPDGLNPAKVEPDGYIIGTHSESGHHHVFDVDVMERGGETNVVMLDTDDPLESWLKVNRPTALRHTKTGPDVHKTDIIQPGLYLIRRQREDSPEGWRKAID